MKLRCGRRPGLKGLAFTLVEVMVSVAIIGVMFVSLYAGISSGFAIVQMARENLRATQIMVEKMEIMRLYSWSQINSNGFVPATFTEYFYPSTTTNSSEGSGILYAGSVTMTNAPVADAYADNMKLVIIGLSWQSGSVTRNRELRSYISENGIQPYLY